MCMWIISVQSRLMNPENPGLAMDEEFPEDPMSVLASSILSSRSVPSTAPPESSTSMVPQDVISQTLNSDGSTEQRKFP